MENQPKHPKQLKPAFININNEIKISQDTNLRQAINFIVDLFTKHNYSKITICGLNKAIKKVVLITEIVKTKLNTTLYQITKIDCINNNGYYNGVEYIENINAETISNRMIPRLEICLSIDEPSPQERKSLGYQKPQNYKQTVYSILKQERIKSKKLLAILRHRKFLRIGWRKRLKSKPHHNKHNKYNNIKVKEHFQYYYNKFDNTN